LTESHVIGSDEEQLFDDDHFARHESDDEDDWLNNPSPETNITAAKLGYEAPQAERNANVTKGN